MKTIDRIRQTKEPARNLALYRHYIACQLERVRQEKQKCPRFLVHQLHMFKEEHRRLLGIIEQLDAPKCRTKWQGCLVPRIHYAWPYRESR